MPHPIVQFMPGSARPPTSFLAEGVADTPVATLRFAAVTPVKGVNIAPPTSDFTADAYGLPPERVAALQEAGFNTVRMFLDAAEVASDPTTLANKWMPWIQSAVDMSMRVVLVMGGSPSWDKSTGTASWTTAVANTAAAIAARWAPETVALEVVNEPYGASDFETYFAPIFWQAARTAAPNLTIIVQSNAGYYGSVPNFVPADFDANTMFAFHPYEVGEVTHHFNYPDLPVLPFPITDYAGGQTQAQIDMEALVNADGSLTSGQKAARIATYTSLFDYLWGYGTFNKDWIAGNFATVDAWVTANNIDPRRVFVSEYGICSNLNFNGAGGPTTAARAKFYRAVRELVEQRGWAGWVAHQALGDFNLFQESAVGTQGTALIPELVDALFSDEAAFPDPPTGFLYLVDSFGNYLVDQSGDYLLGAQ
jgi:hypothetical protein